ncbi:MAG TPA: outer membrane beta-barrel protein [Bacteriovoracaceae bacterium]|nr:outer membrane beta-barrel protein [Bacteriovoracaceae bacterium]
MKSSLLFFFLFSLTTQAQADKFGGFIDTYFAYDFNNPSHHKRAYTTQPVRHNEFNVNLAYLEAILDRPKTRGRLALQFGDSVTRNAAAETRFTRIFQEAYLGIKIDGKTWVDAGIFLGNIGSESWISKDNWTYKRLAEYC